MNVFEKFPIKTRDTDPALEVTLFDVDEFGEKSPVQLGAGTSVVFNMLKRDDLNGTPKVSRGPAVIQDPAAGDVAYLWGASDTDTPGRFFGEFEVTFNDGRVRTYPREGYIRIVIGQDIA
jgi:hypothetical protein